MHHNRRPTNSAALRRAMIANAVFSLLTGGFMLAVPGRVAALLGPPIGTIIVVIGATVAAYAIALVMAAAVVRTPDRIGMAAVAVDLGWVFATVFVLAVWGRELNRVGAWVLVGVATVVALFAFLEARGTDRIYRDSRKPGWYYYEVSGVVPVRPDAIWEAVSDLGAIHRYSPGLTASRVITDGESGGGTVVRECVGTSGAVWQEECTLVKPDRALNVHFRSEDPAFPFPFTTMDGGWRVAPGDGGSKVTTWFAFIPKNRALAFLIVPLVAKQFAKGFPAILDNMTTDARATEAAH